MIISLDIQSNWALRHQLTMTGGPIASREAFTRNDEGGGVGSEVEEEIGQAVASNESTGADDVVSEADDAEEDREQDEPDKLNRLAANGIDGCHSEPVTWDSTSQHQNDVADSDTSVVFIDSIAFCVTDRCENSSVVETYTVESLPSASG